MPLGMSGSPCSTRFMTGSAMVFSSPCRPTAPSPQKRSTAPANTTTARSQSDLEPVRASTAAALMRACADAPAPGTVTTKSAANLPRSCAIMGVGRCPYLNVARLRSVGVLVAQQADRRQEQNFQIQQRRPAPQILEVVVDTRLHVLHPGRLTAAAIHLGEARNARRHLVADHVAL